MKILNVIMCLDPVKGGGGVERTLQISRSLVHGGHQCTILTTDTGLSPDCLKKYEKWGFNILALPSLWQRFYLPRPSQRVIKRLVADADVVQLLNHWTLINVMAYFAIKQLKKPYVVCPAGTLSIYGRSKFLKKLYNYLIGREIIRQADAHIAVASNEIKQFEAYGVRPGRVSVIPNGTNPEDFPASNGNKFRKRYGLNDFPLILFLGRLNSIKGPDLLLDAFSKCYNNGQLHQYHIVFAGPDGGMLQVLKRMASESGLSNRVHFIGHISGDEKSDAYRAADLFVIPSRQEAMSIVVLEAGISGTPVLITDQCGFNDVAAVGGGMVVNASVEGLRSGLLAMTNNFAQLKVMGANLKRFTSSHFLWDHMVKRHLELFSQIVH